MNKFKTFDVDGATVRIDEVELEGVRKVVVAKLQTLEGDIHKALKSELESAVAWVDAENCRLGAWSLNKRKEGFALVRTPPRAAVNHIFVAELARHEGQWLVVNFFEERLVVR